MEFSSNNALKRNLEKYAAQYAAEQERQGSLGDGRSSIHYPALFLFVGDQVAPAVSAVQEINRLKWDNGEGVVYVQIGTEDQDDVRAHSDHDSSVRMKHDNDNRGQLDHSEYSDNVQRSYPGWHRPSEAVNRSSSDDGQVTRHVLPISGAHTGRPSKTLRKDVHRSFHDSDQALFGLNRTLRRVSNRIAEYGRLYSSFDRIYVTVVTRADDPLNVLLPELTKLTETILAQSFKSVQTDLHVLVSEMEQVDSFGYASAAGLAFLRELDYMQGLDYTFSGNLLVTEDGISIPVVHPASPLFDLVYILSDKNERGTGVPGGWIENAEIICRICLLKNRKQDADSSGSVSSTGANTYNNTSFKNNIRTTSDQHGYASAGFAEIRRPNKPIALAVLYHLYRYLLERMRQEPEWSIKDKLAFFGLDGASVERKVEGILPDEDLVSGMSGIMTHNVSFSDLKPLSLREAERALFGHGAEAYFRDNVVRLAEERVRQRSTEGSLRRQAEQARTEHPEVGYFQWAAWSDSGFGSVREALLGLIRDKSVQLESARALLEQRQQERVEDQSFKRALFRDKQNVRNLIDCLLERVYVPKIELLRLENELQLLRVYDTEMEQLHTFSRSVTEALATLERVLRETAVESIAAADEYIGQNVMEYYGKVTEALITDLEAKRGRDVWFEDRHMGDMNRLATEGNERLLQRLMEVCHVMLLAAEPLRVPFEEELLLRANVTITYGDKNVLTRDDLFRRLYRTLEDQAVVRVRVFDYTQEHRYEEKYFFGDHDSAFMDYAAHAEETSRIYKLGVVYEERSSGVEKLNLMGGFHLEDLMVYRNGRVYYDSYTENGYELHPSDLAEKLSPLR